MKLSDPSIALVGPGAIGGVVAGAFIASGHQVTLCARRGFERLSISGAAQLSIEVEVATNPGAVDAHDVVIVAVKSHQIPAAAAWLERLVGPASIVVALQNGIEHEANLRPFVGDASVVPVAIWLPAASPEPGVVELARAGRLDVPDSEAGSSVAGLVDCAFLSVDPAADFASRSWTKLLGNAISGGLGALIGRRFSSNEVPRARELASAMMLEIVLVAAAEGVELDVDSCQAMIDRWSGAGGGHLPSIVVDRLSGRPTEWRARNEVIVRLAERHGIDVPVNRTITTLLELTEPR